LSSEYPYLSEEEIIENLCLQAEDLGDEGLDQYYGWGLVDACAAVKQTPIPESSGAVSLILIISTTTILLILKKAHGPRLKFNSTKD